MKNLKKLLAVLVVVAMMATAMIPAMAATSFANEDAAQKLNAMGLYKGIGTDPQKPNYDLGTSLDRQTGAIMILRMFGLEEEALKMTDAQANAELKLFKDASTIASWAKKQVALAVQKGIIKGIKQGTSTVFQPKAVLNGKAYCTMILAQLGQTFDYKTAANDLAKLGGLTEAQATKYNTDTVLKKDDLVGITYAALVAPYKADNKSIIEKLMDLGKVDAKNVPAELLAQIAPTPVPVAASVYSASVTENGKISVVMSAYAGEAKTADFTVTQAINGATATAVTASVYSQTYNTTHTVVIAVPAVAASADEQSVVYSVKYKETVAVNTAAFVVDASSLSVKSVTSDNLKSLKVAFTKPVDKDSVTTTTVKLYKNGSSTAELTTLNYLSDDKKTLVVANSGATFNQNDSVKVVFDGIKDDASKTAMAKAEKTITLKDTADPVVSKIEVVHNKKLVITASEPLNLDTANIYKTSDVTNANVTFKVDGSYTFAKFTSKLTENKVEVEFLNGLTDGNHVITVEDAKDFAGFKAAKAEVTVTTKADVTAPKAVSVNYVSRSKVEVTFDEEVNASTGTFKVYEIGNATDLYAGGSKAIKADDNKTIVLTLGTTLSVAATVGIDVKYTNVEDTFGNKNTTETTISGKATDDTSKPVVSAYEVIDGNVVKVTFSEKVNAAGATAQFKLYKEDGTTVVDSSAASVVDFDGTNPDSKIFKVTFTGLNNIDSATYKVKVTTTKDLSIRQNVIDDYVFSVTAKDSKAPTLQSAVRKDDTGNNDKIELIFSEKMDATIASSTANYFVGNGSATIALNTITDAKVDSVSTDGKKVVLVVPDADNSNVTGGLSAAVDKIAMPALKDAAGNYISNATLGANFSVATSYVAMTAADLTAEATGKNTIKVTAKNGYTFSQADANTFKFERDGTNGTNVYDLGVIAAQVSTDGTYVTLTTGVSLSADAKYNDSGLQAIDLYMTGTTTKDMNGEAIAVTQANSIDVADKIVATQDTVTVGTAGNANKITVNFDEDVALASGLSVDVLAAGIEVKDGTTVLTPVVDYTVAIVAGDLVVTVIKNGIVGKDLTIEIKRADYLKDANGNSVTVKAVQTAAAVTEKVAPTMVSAVTKNATTLEITFSEDVTTLDTANAGAQFTVDIEGGASGVAGTGPVSINGKVVTVTFAGGTFTTGTDVDAVDYTEVSGDEITDTGLNKLANSAALADGAVTSGF